MFPGDCSGAEVEKGGAMNILISARENVGSVVVPADLLFWGFVAAYVIHILEESIFPEVFVEKVRRLYWPAYGWTRFFWFNTLLLSLNIAAVVVYEGLGGQWIVFPLSLACERVFNGFYHLGETVRTKSFSSGLLSSVITWILAYLIIRYSLLRGQITPSQFVVSSLIGCALFLLMIVPMLTGKLKSIR
jgi:hypothetical protein